nr:tetratricopeptide repeat protein [Bacteroidales bacterium]
NGIQNIYVEQGKADDYVNYLKTIGTMGELSASSQDSLMYRSAENIYLTGDCSRSQVSFQRYLDRFPEGIFALNAHYYLSDCALRSGSEQDALPHLLYIAGKPRNMFTEEALLSAARIEYKMQNYMDAVAHYKTLESLAEVRNNQMEARIGLMRCYDKLNEFSDAYDAADRVLSTEKIPPDVIREARFILAKSAAALDRTDVALENYRKVATEVKSIQGAEAKYRVAEIYWQRKQYDKAEKEIFDFIDMNTPHQYWMARAFILLADIYTLRKDYFQAQQTLQSLIDYYENPDDGIIDMARQRKAAIDQATQKGAARGQDTLEIKMAPRK